MTAIQQEAIQKRRVLERAVVTLRQRFDEWQGLNAAYGFERIAQAAWGNTDSQKEASQLHRAKQRLQQQHERVRRLIAETQRAIAQARATEHAQV